MISEQTKRKFENIVRNMTPDQRAALQAHFTNATEDQKAQYIEKIVAAYDTKQAASEPEEIPYSEYVEEPDEVSPKNVKGASIAPSKRKKKLKKSVKNAFAGILVVILGLAIAVLVFAYKDVLFAGNENSDLTAQTETAVTETTLPPTPSPTPTITPTPAPTQVPVAADHPDLTGLTIVIDPGHQETSDNEQELYASWLSSTKPRCTCGTTGIVTGKPEYELTLEYSNIIAEYLEQCGANVILTRDSNDVDISNQERAAIATSNNAGLFLRIHADAAGDSAASGVRVYIPDSGSFTDTSPSYAEQLAELVAEAEGLEVNTVRATSLYTGLNYANSIRSFQISLGFLSNSDDESVLLNEENMTAVAEAISIFCEEFV